MNNVASLLSAVCGECRFRPLVGAALLAVMLCSAAAAQNIDGVQFVDDLEQSLRRRNASREDVYSQRTSVAPSATATAGRPFPALTALEPQKQEQEQESTGWRSKLKLRNPLTKLFSRNQGDAQQAAAPPTAKVRQGTNLRAGSSIPTNAGDLAKHNTIPSIQRASAHATRDGNSQPQGLFPFAPREASADSGVASDRRTPPAGTAAMPIPVTPGGRSSGQWPGGISSSRTPSMPLPIGGRRSQDLEPDSAVAVVSDRDERSPSRALTNATTAAAARTIPNGPLPEVVGPPGGWLPTTDPFTENPYPLATVNTKMPEPPSPRSLAEGPAEVVNPHALAARPASSWQPASADDRVQRAVATRPHAAQPPSRRGADTPPASTANSPASPQAFVPPVAVRENPVKATPKEPSQKAVELLTQANDLSKSAATEEQYTQVIQLCRHVLAIDDSTMAVDYSRDLASWAFNRRGELRADEGREKEALLDFEDALRLDPQRWRAIHNRGVIAAQAGHYADAFDDFNRTIQLNPEFAKAYSNRATLYVQAGKLHEALDDYRLAIDHDPDLAVAHKGRARACHLLGDFESAIQHYDAAALLAPEDARILNNRGDLLVDMGRYRAAAEDYRRAIELDPQLATAYRNLAWLQATCPDKQCQDHEAALGNANRAVELTPQPSDLEYDTLAAANAAQGDFESAVSLMDKAISLAQEDDVPNYEWRQQLYRRGQPYVTEPSSTIQQASFAD